ncbi:MAG: hypothetical protein M1837_002567 [Sclerophora amabilis]|nr:MAG: hypothetical protein M1837_002567 [Sclerophora amabilis]
MATPHVPGSSSEATATADSLHSALTTAHLDFTIRNPQSLKTYNDSVSHFPGGNTRTVLHAAPFPLTFASGQSCEVRSIDGDVYVDFLGEYTAGIYGHKHPAILSRIQEALSKGWNFGGSSLYEKELAKIVCERFSPTLELVRFTNSGSEANLMAIGAAVNYTRRKKVLVFSNGYHGGTLGFPAPSPENSMNVPHDFVVAPYNDVAKTRALLFGLQPTSLAAILVEPVQGAGGVIAGSPAFLTYLREAATEYGAVLIFDEVMTSRLSYRGFASELGIKPDMMTLGKWVGGGMSFGAFGGRKEIMAMFDPRSNILTHSGTFNNNVVSMAAGIAGCNLLDEQALAKLNGLGEEMKRRIEDVLGKNGISSTAPINDSVNGYHEEEEEAVDSKGLLFDSVQETPIMYVNGVGSMLCIHFSGPDQSVLQALFFHHMLKEHIYIASRGFIALSIEIRPNHVDHFVAALERFVLHFLQVLRR